MQAPNPAQRAVADRIAAAERELAATLAAGGDTRDVRRRLAELRTEAEELRTQCENEAAVAEAAIATTDAARAAAIAAELGAALAATLARLTPPPGLQLPGMGQ